MKRKLLLAALCVAGALGMRAQTKGDVITVNGHKYEVTGDNIISNGSFESGLTGWTSANDFSTELAAGNFTLVETNAQDGEKYLKGTQNKGGADAGSIGTAWSITKGKAYVFSYWLRGEGDGADTGYLISSLTNTKATETYKLGIPSVTKGEWTQFQVVFYNRDYDFCQIDFRWLNGQWGFDNFVLAEVSEVVNDDVAEPALTHLQSFGGESVSSYYYKSATSYPTATADFTIEMDGTADTQIVLKGIGVVYTPTATGKVRFARKDNVVYVYEGQEYKGTIGQYTMYDDPELLADYNFAAVGDKIENNKFKLSNAWTMANTSAYGGTGIRLSDNTSGVNNGTVLIWRGTGNSNYFSQEVTEKVAASTEYKVRVYQFTGSNAGAEFHLGLGNAAGDYSLASVDERLGKKWNTTLVDGVHTMYITTPAELSTNVYFTFKNTNPSTTDKSGQNDALTQIEWISLEKCDGTITGASNVTVLEGAAYAPAGVAEAKVTLKEEIDEANAIDRTTNVGAAAFQIPSAAATALKDAIDAAQAVYDNGSATLSEVETATSTLNGAVTTFNATTLNAPNEADVYSLYLVDGLNKTVTFKAGNPTSGTYAIGYTEDAGSNFNQAIHFKAVSGNQYNLYIEDAEGTKHYICTGAGGGYAGGSTSQIRMTSDDTKALAIEVIATSEAGVYNLKNTVAGAFIGSNGDTGVFTADKYKKFNINAATKASVPVAIAADKWGTRIFPFDVTDIPDGLKAYTVTATAGETIVKSDALSEIPANTPVLLKATKSVDATLQGYGVAKENAYTVGLLTGVYTAATVPVNSYVLQTQDDVQAFYLVDAAFTATANRAYLTVPSSAKAFFFDEATAIASVEAAEAEDNAPAYNVAGQRVQNGYKGIVIKKGKKFLQK